MADFHIKTSDTAPFIEGTCKDHAGDPVDIAGATVHFVMRPFDGDTVIHAEANNDQVSAATTGHVSYEWQAGDLDTPGAYYGEWQVTFTSGEVETFPNDSWFTIAIHEDLGTVAS